jgi:hypothetical protein
MTRQPTKPHLSLRVGITGHRPNKLSRAELPRIERQLREVYAAIEAIVAKAAGKNAQPYRIHLVSGFAEGADQIATAVCPTDWIVEAVLPFPKDEYLKDFERSAAGDGRDVREEFLASLARATVVTELPSSADPRDRAYLLCGRFMLQQIDMLIAVWDGEPPRPGGTGEIVKDAVDGGTPVVWLTTGADEPVSFIVSLANNRPVREPWNERTLAATLEPIFAPASVEPQSQYKRSLKDEL